MRVKQGKNILAPRPVHPRNIRHHGFFGKTFVKQHMMLDKLWTPDSLVQEFRKMSALLKKNAQFQTLEKKVAQKKSMHMYHSLQKECREGRTVLNRLRGGDPQELRNILKDHRFMQRLYQKMPPHMVLDNINQRTFYMRKEYDRLESRLEQLKNIYNKKLLERGTVENRIKYANEFKLDEDARISELQKKVENSQIRLKAVKAINSTYKRIIQILRHDEIFYEPILNSLDADIQDQSKFIKHILYLGSPAIVRFKELSEQYKYLDEKARKSGRLSIQECAYFRKINAKTHQRIMKPPGDVFYRVRLYMRETNSMQKLKAKFEEIEDMIKQIQIATLCSREKDIYPRIKSQVNNNLKLGSKIENEILSLEVLETKMKSASVLKGVLVNNLAEDVIGRLNKIDELKAAIKKEDEFEEKTMEYLKNRRPVFVVLRMFLWNLYDIMKHVGPRRIAKLNYPVEYLKLPLLKFEMLPTKAFAPDAFEENLIMLLNVVLAKLKLITSALSSDLSVSTINGLTEEYCTEMLNIMDNETQSNQDSHYHISMQPDAEIDLMEEVRSYQKIINRRQIKMASARLVEEHMKKEE